MMIDKTKIKTYGDKYAINMNILLYNILLHLNLLQSFPLIL